MSAELARLTTAAALAGCGAALLGWLGPRALAGGPAWILLLVMLLAPLAVGLQGLLLRRLRTARWLSLALPFYGAAFLVGAVGNPAARGWVTLGAFCTALAFAAGVSWIRRTGATQGSRSLT